MPFLGRNRTLFRILGIPIQIDLSWLLLLGLVVWSLADGYFPYYIEEIEEEPHLSQLAYWTMGVIGAAGLFASLITHELCHSLVARATGMQVSGITLFIFGGVSKLGDEPPTAASEFFMAVVGPLSSVLIGAFFLGTWLVATLADVHAAVIAVLQYLSLINFILAGFNSLPAFPLDGGRVLRSILWGLTGDLGASTRVAAGIGSAFGVGMVIVGVVLAFFGSFIPGIWLIFIGLFLRRAASGSVQQMVIRQLLEGEPVSRFMTREPVGVSPELPLRLFVDDYVLNYHFTHFPVVDGEGHIVGIVNASDPKKINPIHWAQATVTEVMTEADEVMKIRPDADAVEALSLLRGQKSRRLIVVENDRPVGILSLRDLMDFLALKIDLTPRLTIRHH